jgi:hypothetical protein
MVEVSSQSLTALVLASVQFFRAFPNASNVSLKWAAREKYKVYRSPGSGLALNN